MSRQGGHLVVAYGEGKLERGDRWFGEVGATSLVCGVARSGSIDTEFGVRKRISRRESEGEERERDRGKKGKRERYFFLNFKSRIYTFCDFSEQNFIFVYFELYF